MRVLIVGAGVAGLTLAALLRQQGREAEIVERAPSFAPNGYALMVYPLGGGVLHGLGLYDEFRARGMAFDTFSLADGHGRAIEDYDLREITDTVGPMVSIRRPDLLSLLYEAAGPERVRHGTTVVAVEAEGDAVAVTLSDGSAGRYDAVVASDGMHSPTRRLLFGDDGETRETRHAMFVWWGADGLCEPGRVTEWWGRGRVAAVCPVPGAVQCSIVVPGELGDATADRSPEALRQVVEAALDGVGGAGVDGMRASAASAEEIYRWPLYDVRTRDWTTAGRLALLGDAAVGFLPTAGVGASSAMRAAAILADELARVDGGHVPHALDLYVRRARRLAELHQDQSRRFGRAMLMDSSLGVPLRDLLLRHVSASHLLSRLLASMHEPA